MAFLDASLGFFNWENALNLDDMDEQLVNMMGVYLRRYSYQNSPDFMWSFAISYGLVTTNFENLCSGELFLTFLMGQDT